MRFEVSVTHERAPVSILVPLRKQLEADYRPEDDYTVSLEEYPIPSVAVYAGRTAGFRVHLERPAGTPNIVAVMIFRTSRIEYWFNRLGLPILVFGLGAISAALVVGTVLEWWEAKAAFRWGILWMMGGLIALLIVITLLWRVVVLVLMQMGGRRIPERELDSVEEKVRAEVERSDTTTPVPRSLA